MGESRPSAVAEVRAWLVVAVAILVHTAGMAWWGAVLTTKVDSLKELAISSNGQYKELESRTRQNERDIQKIMSVQERQVK